MLSAIVNSVTNRMQRSPAMLFTRDRCSFARDGVSAENSLHHRVTHDHLGLDAIDLNSCQNTHYCHSPAGCCGIGATGVGCACCGPTAGGSAIPVAVITFRNSEISNWLKPACFMR